MKLTFQEKLRMAEIYREAGLTPTNPKQVVKNQKEWHRDKKR